MAIPSLRCIAGSIVIKDNLQNKLPDKGTNFNYILFQKWECLKYDELITEGIKQHITITENEFINDSQDEGICPINPTSVEKEAVLTGKVNELFRELSQVCNTASVFGKIIPIAETSYHDLGQIWADEAFMVLWGAISQQINLPNLATLEEKRAWLENPQNTPLLNQITHLNLSNANIRIFPSEIKYCPQLTDLSLDNNLIAIIPDLTNLAQLRILSLNDNLIAIIPDFTNLAQLRILSLNNNLIAIIPDFTNLAQLGRLFLDDNLIAIIPDFTNLARLIFLSLNGNQIATIPDFTNLAQLVCLYLHNNQIAAIPDFTNLARLNNLYLNNNRIAAIPDLTNCPLLIDLSLNDNLIAIIPDFTNLAQLMGLSLNNNLIVVIPDFTNLARLRTLLLDNNRIAIIPDFTNLYWLRILSLYDNRIAAIPDFTNLAQLEIIYLDNNLITTIPNFTHCPLLKSLFLNCNRIATISNFTNLALRLSLDLDDNPLLFIFDKDSSYGGHHYCLQAYNSFKEHNCTSKLSSFLKLLALETDNTQKIKEAFFYQERDDQCLIFEMVYKESGETSKDLQWGEHHTFDNMHLFCRATRKAISMKFDRLSPENKNGVYGKIFEIASPVTDDAKWGENNAFGNVLRLIDAMALI